MKKLFRIEMQNVIGGKLSPNSGGAATCTCLPGDTGTCNTYRDGSCECSSTGSPSQYSLYNSACKASTTIANIE